MKIQTEYECLNLTRTEGKSANTERYEAEAVVIQHSDLSFAGLGLHITHSVSIVLEAESLEQAVEITEEELWKIHEHKSHHPEHGHTHYYNIQQEEVSYESQV